MTSRTATITVAIHSVKQMEYVVLPVDRVVPSAVIAVLVIIIMFRASSTVSITT